MTSKPISPLRQRMIDDMKFRNMSPSTEKVYAYAVANFSAFHRRSPDKLGIEHVREYRLHLMARGLKATSINPIVGALRFFYGVTLGKKEIAEQIAFARKEDTLPAVLTRDEVLRLLKAEPNLKMRTAFITIYAAGLRVSEAVTPRGRTNAQCSRADDASASSPPSRVTMRDQSCESSCVCSIASLNHIRFRL